MLLRFAEPLMKSINSARAIRNGGGQTLSKDTGQPVVELHDVQVTYPGDIVALEHISLEVRAGDFLGLIGPNGAGKSTILSVIVGLVKPTSGYVKLFGAPVSAENLKKVGFVPQTPHTKDWNFPATVYETVLLGRVPLSNHFPWFDEEDHAKAVQALDRLGIGDLKRRSINELSGGQMQRVFTAKALVGDPQLLIFDEPTSGVDAHAKSEFYSILEKLNIELGITTILSLHDIGVVTKLAKTIVCVNRTLYFDGKTKDFDAGAVLSKAYGYPIEVVEHGEHP
jgi:zinc transport system ATP-binding protein